MIIQKDTQMTTDVVTKEQAIQLGLKYYFTGVPCSNGHLAPRTTKKSVCKECRRLAHYSYYAKHRETAIRGISKWQQEHKDVVNSATAKWRENNPDSSKRSVDKYYQSHKEVKLAKTKEWRKKNKPLLQFYNSTRRSQIKKAFVSWADVQQMVEIYKSSIQLSEQTGIPHQVDHIIPLQHDLVCGLHWEGNLQILSTRENQIKSNRFIVG
jgi:hypothetical protein